MTICALNVAQNSKQEFTDRYNRYHSFLPRTKMYLSTNQEKYFPGDTIFFQCYYLTDSLTLVSGKHLVTVALSDFRGKNRTSSTLITQQGSGNSHLILPDTIPAGFYRLIAFTNWMRNFPLNTWGGKEITIVRRNQLEKKPNELNVKVDGGRIVRNLNNRLIINTPLPNQLVRLFDEGKHEITSAHSDGQGLAELSFMPNETLEYFIKSNDYPDVELGRASDGALISIENKINSSPTQIQIFLPPHSKYEKKQLTLLITAWGKVFYSNSFIATDKNFLETNISKESLPNGLNTVFLLDPEGQLISSKDFLINNRSKITTGIHLAKNKLLTRENVQIEVEVVDEVGLPVEGQFSISIRNLGVLGTSPINKKAGHVPNSFSTTDVSENLDRQLILDHQPEDWSKILVKKFERPNYNFYSTLQKKGLAFKSDSITPLPESTTLLFYFQKSGLRYQTSVAKNGEFSLNLLDFYGEDELFYLAQYQDEPIKNVYVRWVEDQFRLPTALISEETNAIDPYAAFAKSRATIEKAFNAYANTKIDSSFFQKREVKDIAEPDVEIDVTSYISFSTVPELINEIIPSISCQQRNKKTIVRVGLPYPMKEKDDPLFFIDGVATKNTQIFLALKPQEIQTIKVIYQPRKLLPLGLLGKNGIVIVTTKKGNNQIIKRENGLKVTGLTKPLDFGNQDPSREPSQKPIFKSTLFWMPAIKIEKETKKSLAFWLTDDVGEMEVLVEGITKNGVLFSTSTSFHVTQSK